MNANEHRNAAESLLEQAQEEFERLRAVPLEGITRFPDGHWEIGDTETPDNGGNWMSQTRRRDELGKSIQGKYAMAQVHATLYQGDMTAQLAMTTALKR